MEVGYFSVALKNNFGIFIEKPKSLLLVHIYCINLAKRSSVTTDQTQFIPGYSYMCRFSFAFIAPTKAFVAKFNLLTH